jgi:hypothetical protein
MADAEVVPDTSHEAILASPNTERYPIGMPDGFVHDAGTKRVFEDDTLSRVRHIRHSGTTQPCLTWEQRMARVYDWAYESNLEGFNRLPRNKKDTPEYKIRQWCDCYKRHHLRRNGVDGRNLGNDYGHKTNEIFSSVWPWWNEWLSNTHTGFDGGLLFN